MSSSLLTKSRAKAGGLPWCSGPPLILCRRRAHCPGNASRHWLRKSRSPRHRAAATGRLGCGSGHSRPTAPDGLVRPACRAAGTDAGDLATRPFGSARWPSACRSVMPGSAPGPAGKPRLSSSPRCAMAPALQALGDAPAAPACAGRRAPKCPVARGARAGRCRACAGSR